MRADQTDWLLAELAKRLADLESRGEQLHRRHLSLDARRAAPSDSCAKRLRKVEP